MGAQIALVIIAGGVAWWGAMSASADADRSRSRLGKAWFNSLAGGIVGAYVLVLAKCVLMLVM